MPVSVDPGSAATRTSCPACHSGATSRELQVRDFTFRRCGRCRSVYVAVPPAPAELQALYEGGSYFRNPEFGAPERGGYHGYKDYCGDLRHIEEKAARLLDDLERLLPPGRLLDVGAGPGLFVSVAARRGWDAVGLDVNPWAARYAAEELGVEVRKASLEEAGFGDATFDAVALLDVVEHVVEPDAFVGEVARILRPGGVVVVVTPDAGSRVSRALGTRWPEMKRVPEHLVLFSGAGLAALLVRHGLEPLERRSIGKRSSVRTLVDDVGPLVPRKLRPALRRLAATHIGDVVVDLNPRTKFCLYARRAG